MVEKRGGGGVGGEETGRNMTTRDREIFRERARQRERERGRDR